MKSDRVLVDELFGLLGLEKESVLEIVDDTKLDDVIMKAPMKGIRGVKMVDVSDTVYKFWLLKKHNVLSRTCFVMMGGMAHSNGINDLKSIYGGVLWGDIFLFVYRDNNNAIAPSQRGLFLS